MNQTDAPEIFPAFINAARKALLVHSKKQSKIYPIDEVARIIAECMEKECPDTVVLIWGRELALTLLAVVEVESPAVDGLRQSIETGASFWDDMGDPKDFDPTVAERVIGGKRFAELAHEAHEAARAEPVSAEEWASRGLLTTCFDRHQDALPAELLVDYRDHLAVGGGPANTDMVAAELYAGVVGPFVHLVGRDFASLVADELPVLELFDLYALLVYAVSACQTPYDTLGHLDHRDKALMLYA